MKSKIVRGLHKHHKILISVIPAVLYFMIMYRFYDIDFYVPDFSLYYSMAETGFKAKDGFSSLFIFLSTFVGGYPKQMTFLCLILLTLSLFNIGIFITTLCENNTLKLCFGYIVLYSSGVWFYFYGKLYYDFPFSAFTYSLCLLCVTGLYMSREKEKHKSWFALSFLCGFLMSWKMYNLFAFAGLGLLILCNDKVRKEFVAFAKSIKRSMMAMLFFALGYLAGNYNLILYPKETIEGIKAYPASYDISQFFILKTRIIWDHVGDLPFNLSVMNIGSAIILLYIFPVLFRRLRFLLVSAFMTICFCYFINNYSPGYAWHGLTFGLFIITFWQFMLVDINISGNHKKILLSIAIGVQVITCYFCYIPIQTDWFEKTNEAVNVLSNNSEYIFRDIDDIAELVSPESYSIDVALKRYRPVALLELKRDRERNYVRTGYQFWNPLMLSNVTKWIDIMAETRYIDDNPDNIIYVVPNVMLTMGDVAEIHKYDALETIKKIYRDGYTIILKKNNISD